MADVYSEAREAEAAIERRVRQPDDFLKLAFLRHKQSVSSLLWCPEVGSPGSGLEYRKYTGLQ